MYSLHSLQMNGVHEVEEVSAPRVTLQDTEQERVTASIATLPSTPPQSEILIPEPSQQHPPTIDSDPVPPPSRVENIDDTIRTSNPAATYQSEAPTTERISDGANEEFTTHFEASLCREVYHSRMF